MKCIAIYGVLNHQIEKLAAKNGTGWIRTSDLALRRRLLYPAELQPQNWIHHSKFGSDRERQTWFQGLPPISTPA